MSVGLAERMHQAEPFFREVGTGPGVSCIHSNASTLEQWSGLMELLAPKFRVLAPDSYVVRSLRQIYSRAI